MTTPSLDALIERLERAEGPITDYMERRDIAEVARAAGFVTFETDNLLKALRGSLDAALSLVPAHHLWQVKRGFVCEAIVWSAERDYDDSGHVAPVGRKPDGPALALCIAALKARRGPT